MPESKIRINQPGTGSYLKTFQSVDGGGNTVEAQALVPTDSTGIESGTVANPLKVFQACSASAVSRVAASVVSVTLLAANANRRQAVIVNDSLYATLYVKLGAAASLVDFSYPLLPGSTLELPEPIYPGIIDGIWNVASGAAQVTELT